MGRALLLAASLAALVSAEAAAGATSSELPATRAELLRARRRAKAEALAPYRVSPLEARLRALEKARFPQNIFVKGFRGVRPRVGGMPSGSGLVGGIGYVRGLDGARTRFEANARRSTRGYTMLDTELLVPGPRPGRRIELSLRGAFRDFTSVNFFGLGEAARAEDRSTFRLRDTALTSALWVNPRGLLSFAGEGGWSRVETGPGTAGRPVDGVFAPGSIPGFDEAPTNYGLYGGWIELDLREKSVEPAVGIVFRLTARRYEELGGERYDFTRIVGDLKAYVPLGVRSRVLALRVRTSHAAADETSAVPFYFMETLGGAASLRGFREYRLRDRRNLLLSAEYRWEVWTYVDLAVFVDAGKVFSAPGELDLSGLRTGYGLGLRAHAPGDVTFRIDLARSTEGLRLHVGGGPRF